MMFAMITRTLIVLCIGNADSMLTGDRATLGASGKARIKPRYNGLIRRDRKKPSVDFDAVSGDRSILVG
jgi:hypothetical protein